LNCRFNGTDHFADERNRCRRFKFFTFFLFFCSLA